MEWGGRTCWPFALNACGRAGRRSLEQFINPNQATHMVLKTLPCYAQDMIPFTLLRLFVVALAAEIETEQTNQTHDQHIDRSDDCCFEYL